jgi:hypothetical protein
MAVGDGYSVSLWAGRRLATRTSGDWGTVSSQLRAVGFLQAPPLVLVGGVEHGRRRETAFAKHEPAGRTPENVCEQDEVRELGPARPILNARDRGRIDPGQLSEPRLTEAALLPSKL